MKRNFDLPMLDFDGKEFGDKATMKTVAFTVLNTAMEGDDKLPMAQKMEMFALLQSIYKGGEVEVTAENIALLKERAARCLSLIAFGIFVRMLEDN